MYTRLAKDHDGCISIHIGAALSATAESARVGAQSVEGFRVDVIDSQTVTMPMAFLCRVAAEAATDGCDPVRWRDDWLIDPRPGGDQPIIGAVARTIDEWREHVVAGHGISLCPASAETFYARPGLAFVASQGVPPSVICVAWRADDTAPTVHRFVDLVTAAAQADRL